MVALPESILGSVNDFVCDFEQLAYSNYCFSHTQGEIVPVLFIRIIVLMRSK